eukprot:1136766-Pelagomonas_calceolata.AAC.2
MGALMHVCTYNFQKNKHALLSAQIAPEDIQAFKATYVFPAANCGHPQVLIRHGHVFLDSPAAQERLSALHIRCHEVMCRRAASLSDHALHSPQILTAAVASVLQRTPLHLAWQQLSQSGSKAGSFEAVSEDGRLFSINTLDGTVLYDGCPPSRLPKAILNHRMYKRSFGDNNFEVGCAAAVAFKVSHQTFLANRSDRPMSSPWLS